MAAKLTQNLALPFEKIIKFVVIASVKGDC